MNRFGIEIDTLADQAARQIRKAGQMDIDTALGLLDCGHDPHTLAEVEETNRILTTLNEKLNNG